MARSPRSAASAGALVLVAFMTMPQVSAQQSSASAPSDDEIRTVVNAQLTFETSDDGRVLAVVLHQNGVAQRARH